MWIKAAEIELLLDVVEACHSDDVTIEIVEPIHDPEKREHNPVDLAGELDFSWANVPRRACLIKGLALANFQVVNPGLVVRVM